MPLGGTTGAQEVCPARSSRTSAYLKSLRPQQIETELSHDVLNPPRATLIGEQPNPWDLLQPRDVTSRHRGAKPLRRYELLGGISLLSPEYLLSEYFHAEPPDHYAQVSFLEGTLEPRYAFGGDHPSQTTHQAMSPLTPFVQVGTYPTRNFATLGPL